MILPIICLTICIVVVFFVARGFGLFASLLYLSVCLHMLSCCLLTFLNLCSICLVLLLFPLYQLHARVKGLLSELEELNEQRESYSLQAEQVSVFVNYC